MSERTCRNRERRSACIACIESAEPRLLLSDFAKLEDGSLLITGTTRADVVRIESRGNSIFVRVNGHEGKFAASLVDRLAVNLRRGNDWIQLKTRVPASVRGEGGNDTIVGGSGNDSLYAGSGNDRVYGGDGDDSIESYDGNDFVAPGAGRDVVQLGTGIDELSYGDRTTGVDIAFEYRLVNTSPTTSSIVSECQLNVGPETDQVSNVEILTGSVGDDTLSMAGVRADPGIDASDETIYSRLYRINGGHGNDVIDVTHGGSDLAEPEVVSRQIADGGEGNDTLNAIARGETTLIGGPGDDQFNSTTHTAFEPVIDGGEGIDAYHLVSNNISIYAMPPTLENLTIARSSEGELRIFGNTLSNRIIIEATYGPIWVDARYGFDYIDARQAIVGSTEGRSVELLGGGGEDTILGSIANDRISGNAGNDYLFGSDGIDTLNGDAYDDVLDGGAGSDEFHGGGGHDRAKSDPSDSIVDSIEVFV